METLVGLVVIAIIGGIVGWIASLIMGTDAQMGMVANVGVGVVGATLGSWLARAVGFPPHSLLAGALIGLLGAVILIGILKAVGVLK